MNSSRARTFARLAYLGLLAWQVTWLALLPPPLGKQAPVLTALLTVPMLIPLPGVLRLQDRALIWAGYLVLLLAVFGMVELWAAPAERPAAALQLGLCVGFLGFLAAATRKRRG